MKSIKQGKILTIGVSALVSLGVVTGLFLLMKTLITKDFGEIDSRQAKPIPTIIQAREEITKEFRQEEIEEIDEVEPPPPDIEIEIEDTDVNISSLSNRVGATMKFEGPSFNPNQVDGDLFPVTIPQPQYPSRAAERGIEGYVVLSFDVLKDGSTANHKVIENARLMSDGSFKIGAAKVFERAALKAAERLKYKPKVIDGKPVVVADYYYKFTFQLDN